MHIVESLAIVMIIKNECMHMHTYFYSLSAQKMHKSKLQERLGTVDIHNLTTDIMIVYFHHFSHG